MIDAIGLTLIGLGVAFDLIGCIGMVRMPDTAPIRVTALLCVVFVLTTSPTAAHALARAAHASGIGLWEKSVVDQLEEGVRDG